MPDSSLGEWIFNDLIQAAVEWFARGWLEAPRIAQIAVGIAMLVGLIVLILGVLAYPGILAIVGISCGIALLLMAILIVFTIAVIRGE